MTKQVPIKFSKEDIDNFISPYYPEGRSTILEGKMLVKVLATENESLKEKLVGAKNALEDIVSLSCIYSVKQTDIAKVALNSMESV